MNPLEFILDKLKQLEGRMTALENNTTTNHKISGLAMEEMSTTIGLMMAQLLPILNERKLIEKAMKEAAIERLFEVVAKTQKYPM